MKNLTVDFQQFIQINDSQVVTTSEFIAEAFNKRHDNVLAKIDELLMQVPDYFGKLNFKETEKSRKNNLGFEVKTKSYELTKDGFMLLVMGFTGKMAMAIKIGYIEAFNKMAEIIQKSYNSPKLSQLSTIADRKPLREAVNALVMKKDLGYAEAWHLVHQYIGCKAEEMTTEQVKQAIEYCHRLMFAEVLLAKPTVEWERQYGLNISKEAQDALYNFYFDFRTVINYLHKVFNAFKTSLPDCSFEKDFKLMERIENQAHDFLARFKIRDKDNALIRIAN